MRCDHWPNQQGNERSHTQAWAAPLPEGPGTVSLSLPVRTQDYTLARGVGRD